MIQVTFAQHPQSIGVGNTAVDVRYKHDGGAWIARMDALPDGATEITDAEYEAIRVEIETHNAALPADEPVSAPSPGGLLEAVFTAFGKDAARAMARQYPDVTIAIDRQRWDLVYEAVDDMLADAFITQAQYDSLLALMAQHGVPPRAV